MADRLTMSPRYTPKSVLGPEPDLVERTFEFEAKTGDPYLYGSSPDLLPRGARAPSFFKDLLTLTRANRTAQRRFEARVKGVPSDLSTVQDEHEIEAARKRIERLRIEKRDIASSTFDGLHPSAPSKLADEFGRAARMVATLADALPKIELHAGMVDTISSVPVVKLPRLSGGASVAAQTAENAAVAEQDPTSTLVTSPIAEIAGQTDISRQLLQFSQPGIDLVVVDDLGRAHGNALDQQIISGTAASGQTRGLLNVSGILSVTGAVTSASTFLISLWETYSQLAGSSSGFGVPDPSQYLIVMHPRRYAWMKGGVSGSLPPSSELPGQVIISGSIPTGLGSNTNEDTVIIAHRDSLLLVLRDPEFRVFEETGSANLTVRISTWQSAALLVKAPSAVAKIVSLQPPSGF